MQKEYMLCQRCCVDYCVLRELFLLTSVSLALIFFLFLRFVLNLLSLSCAVLMFVLGFCRGPVLVYLDAIALPTVVILTKKHYLSPFGRLRRFCFGFLFKSIYLFWCKSVFVCVSIPLVCACEPKAPFGNNSVLGRDIGHIYV